jgi:hypothetical protein
LLRNSLEHHSILAHPTSANGSFASKAAEAVLPCTSAALPKADVNSPPWLPPLCAISRREQVQQDSPEKTPPNLFNNLVGQREQLVRHGQAKCLGGRQIDYQIELGWLLDRKVAGLGAA